MKSKSDYWEEFVVSGFYDQPGINIPFGGRRDHDLLDHGLNHTGSFFPVSLKGEVLANINCIARDRVIDFKVKNLQLHNLSEAEWDFLVSDLKQLSKTYKSGSFEEFLNSFEKKEAESHFNSCLEFWLNHPDLNEFY